jgi:hypothetical protein
MTDSNVIAFPVRGAPPQPTDDFSDWMAWAESELAILGYEVSATSYNWRLAHQRGLRPEVAADHAVRGLQAG